MGSRRAWVAAARPEQALLAPMCVAVGSSYAHFDSQPGPGLPAHLVVTLAALLAGVGVNFVDAAWDRAQAPPPDPKTPIPDDLQPLEPAELAVAGAAAIAFAALCGAGLVPLSGAAAIGYGALAVVLGAVRGIPAVGLDALGWGLSEIAAVVALGPLSASVGFASQAGSGSWGAVLAGIPAGLVAATPLLARRLERGDHGVQLRQALWALPLLAIAAVTLAVRAGEYGSWAYGAAAPIAVAAAAAWRLSPAPDEDESRRWTVWTTGCAVAALAIIVVALRVALPE